MLKENNFIFFTKLLKSKIDGGLVSESVEENVIYELKDIVEQRKIFDCPACGNSIQIGTPEITYQCDCGNLINTETIPFGKRYRLNAIFFDLLNNFFSRPFAYSNQKISIIFGEKMNANFQHNGQIVIHITPFDVWQVDTDVNINILDTAYVDHFFVSWNLFNKIIVNEEREKIFGSILRLRRETIEKQIDWGKIDEWDFEKMSHELLQKENSFSKIVPGGKGPDQGKDGFGYSTIKMPSGKEIKINTLIQCKYTSSKKSFSFSDIQGYVSRAKQHQCNSLLFITNGELSGDAISAIESDAFKEKDFYDVDFYNTAKLMDLLGKHDAIRIKYFFTSMINNDNT